MAYKYRFDVPKHIALRKYRRFMKLLGIFLLIVIIGYLIFLWYVSQGNNGAQPQGGLRSNSFNPLKTFSSPYFSFQTDKSWRYVPKESGGGKYVYRSLSKNIVKSDLEVYVNTLPQNLLLTHVLPVQANGDRFEVGDVSQHCRDYLHGQIQPGNNNPIEGTVESVRIDCQIDGTSNTVGTGMKHGSYQTELAGKQGANRYYLLYHDLEFTPQFANFVNIAWSFRAK